MSHVSLCLMDASQLACGDARFDAAPYLINVVPDPIQACREMVRVCRPGGRIVLLNHFEDVKGICTRLTRASVGWPLV